MKPVIYVDILFIINYVVNYLLLLATQKICKHPSPSWRLSIGAAAGGIYAVLIFLPPLSILYSLAAKLVVSVALIVLSFRISKWRELARLIIMFYAASFMFAGAAFGLFYFTDIGSYVGAAVSNGVFYFNLPLKTLIVSAAASYALIRIACRIFNVQMRKSGNLFNIRITLNGKTAKLFALLDTGNTLNDPISGDPVIIVEHSSIAHILPERVNLLFEQHSADSFAIMEHVMSPDTPHSADDTYIPFRLIPFRSLGQENGMIPAFKPDSIIFADAPKDSSNALIGVSAKRISAGQSYTALMNPQAVNI